MFKGASAVDLFATRNEPHSGYQLKNTRKGISPIKIGGGGDGFFLACEDMRRMFDHPFPACAFFFFLMEISSLSQIPLFRPVAQQAKRLWLSVP